MKTNMIAACGMNCTLCVGHLREKNQCPGCRALDELPESNKTYCRKCIIKNCPVIEEKSWKYCSVKCEKYPCRRLKNLDKRYRTKYGMSMIENLEFIQDKGIRKFIKHEKARWMKGGKIFCVHNKNYYNLPS